MELFRMELIIPDLPSSGNAKLDDHYIVQWDENKKWHQVVYLHARKKGLPPKPLNRCKLTLIRHGSVYLDYDNLTISFKSIVDGLTRANVIADDSWEVTGKWEIDQKKVKRKDTFVQIIVEELPYSGPDIKPRSTTRTFKPKINRVVSRRKS